MHSHSQIAHHAWFGRVLKRARKANKDLGAWLTDTAESTGFALHQISADNDYGNDFDPDGTLSLDDRSTPSQRHG